ncbi:GNAT family N-acetyltransferase [Priestia taiwanensis]|uniref:N-acetyltransferase n=1 Tax=Priestia taiwanensis TaxID=1347902 RepID=A0A917ENT3_9BACI|nr:GNAT family N-acetyltransferase [Priestia taiwanensis]MBM7362289.1 ribosomal protein S18 acetylase RimI-like enzyme [Priestia taiwanensis]GGE60986.1 N-acetyltransferase [Priestia taiwanensis]
MISIRELRNKELDFLMDMHYESIHIEQNKPPKEELLHTPALKKYNEDWGRIGDKALVAVKNNELVGAVWYRLFDEPNKGYGFINDSTPELGIAILPAFRQQGIGHLLMKAMIQEARLDGYSALSLSVDSKNKDAIRLYEKLGFERVGIEGTSWTMKRITISEGDF